MRLFLNRYYKDSKQTLGVLSIEGLDDPIFHTIERPDKNNTPFLSCIPAGEYKIKPFKSTKFKQYPDVWQIMDVKDREWVLMHVANRAEQLEGCVAVGLSAGYMMGDDQTLQKAVLNSRHAFNQLKSIIGYTEHTLIIRG